MSTSTRCPRAIWQPVDGPLTASAIFLTLSIDEPEESAEVVRQSLAGLSGAVKNISFRDPDSHTTCTVGIGSSAWDRLFRGRVNRPAELHDFCEVRGPRHTAVSTPGDLLFHIRSERHDFCFELERHLVTTLGRAVKVIDETIGFRYMDNRDLLGFVDGMANPTGREIRDSTVVTIDEDCEELTGGSYVVVQKYLHDMQAWGALSVEEQETIIGRTKLDNQELDDAEGKQAHPSNKTLKTVVDGTTGRELSILRDNMPFGSPAKGIFGTYFVGYTRRLWVLEKMIESMFTGYPNSLHDRLLDFSKPVTGSVFFVPSSTLLSTLADE